MLGDGSDYISVSDVLGSDPEAMSLSLSDTTELFRFTVSTELSKLDSDELDPYLFF